ncbi:hypothetical protein VN12_26570 [Pirellula sp. SH-Sr6A]|uniref:hypothetical protein n=1 Tax=Pirellula sp. SH-Sr6A TaxID=1632865 RepID=UPI00078DBAFD|nr:hypothetical protein [Pirellula sp. SH-Sr6A]AMV35685.1 hypothetical protein VN12_26570 [Pirellula sp. SH-Sr6A]
MNKHTSAPWDISGQLIVGPPEPFPNPKAQHMGKVVAELRWDFDGDHNATESRIDYQEMTKNARLIAASPDLLKELDNLVFEARGYLRDLDRLQVDATTLVGAISRAQAVMQKARGQ